MRVKMKALMAGPEGVVQRGAVVDLPRARALELVRGGYATPVREAVPERATLLPGERADFSHLSPDPSPAERGEGEVRARTASLEVLLGGEAAAMLDAIGITTMADLRKTSSSTIAKQINGVGRATADKWKAAVMRDE